MMIQIISSMILKQMQWNFRNLASALLFYLSHIQLSWCVQVIVCHLSLDDVKDQLALVLNFVSSVHGVFIYREVFVVDYRLLVCAYLMVRRSGLAVATLTLAAILESGAGAILVWRMHWWSVVLVVLSSNCCSWGFLPIADICTTSASVFHRQRWIDLVIKISETHLNLLLQCPALFGVKITILILWLNDIV